MNSRKDRFRVLMLYPGNWKNVSKGSSVPLGMAYLASTLKKNGFEVAGLDIGITPGAVRENYLNAPPDTLEQIRRFNPDMVGMTCYTQNRHNVFFWAGAVKKALPGCRIAVGGPHASLTGSEILENVPSVDYIVQYEGEASFLELCRSLEGSPEAPPIAGILSRSNPIGAGKFCSPIMDLDSIPFPDRDIFPVKEYNISIKGVFDGPATHMITSRGCPFKCKFCCTSHFRDGRVVYRSVDNVLEEVDVIVQKYGITNIFFYDDCLTLKKSRVSELCEKILNRNLNIRWLCWSRFNTTTPELLQLMHRAGCRLISFGLESGNQQMLDSMGKRTRVEDVAPVVSECKKLGIFPRTSVIIGMPGETEAMAADTVSLLKKIKIHPEHITVNYSTAYFPGTRWFDEFKVKNPDFSWFNTPQKFYTSAVFDSRNNFIMPIHGFDKTTTMNIRRRIDRTKFNYSLFSYPEHAWLLIKNRLYSTFKNIKLKIRSLIRK